MQVHIACTSSIPDIHNIGENTRILKCRQKELSKHVKKCTYVHNVRKTRMHTCIHMKACKDTRIHAHEFTSLHSTNPLFASPVLALLHDPEVLITLLLPYLQPPWCKPFYNILAFYLQHANSISKHTYNTVTQIKWYHPGWEM